MPKVLLFLLLLPILCGAQELDLPDDKYLEDQFYLGLTYNIILNRPENINQRNLSYGLNGGFIKDIPFNSDRTFGLGIGVGYGINSYYTNLIASETDLGIAYTLPGEGVDLNRNKLETHSIEFPIEIRWRNSTAGSHRFWRIYAGAKLGYIFSGRSKVVTDNGKSSFENPHIQDFQYGIMLNVGYNTFNFHAYYGLNEILDPDLATFNGEPIRFKALRLGVIFYIL